MRRLRRRVLELRTPEPRQREDGDRQLKCEPDGDKRQRGEAVVVRRADLNVVELVVEADEKRQRLRKHHDVREDDAEREQGPCERGEHAERDPGLRRGGRSQIRPQLPEDDRQHESERRTEADLDRGRERLGDAKSDELLVVGQGPREQLDQAGVNGERGREGREERDQADGETAAELAEMAGELRGLPGAILRGRSCIALTGFLVVARAGEPVPKLPDAAAERAAHLRKPLGAEDEQQQAE